MIVYKRKISNLYTIVGGISQEPITPGGPRIPGEDIVPPKSLLIYLTQNIEDLGIYEDIDGLVNSDSGGSDSGGSDSGDSGGAGGAGHDTPSGDNAINGVPNGYAINNFGNMADWPHLIDGTIEIFSPSSPINVVFEGGAGPPNTNGAVWKLTISDIYGNPVPNTEIEIFVSTGSFYMTNPVTTGTPVPANENTLLSILFNNTGTYQYLLFYSRIGNNLDGVATISS